MKIQSIIGICLLTALLFSHCRSPKENKNTVSTSHLETYENKLFLGKGGWMLITEDLHLIGIDLEGEGLFYCQDVLRPDSFFRFGAKGPGPEEYIFPYTIQFIDNSTIGIYDLMQKKYSTVSFKASPKAVKKKQVSVDRMSFRILQTCYNQYIGIGAYPDGMFSLFDSLGTHLKSFFEYPCKDGEEGKIRNELRAMAYQGKTVSNLSRTKFAYAASSADIIHFYDIQENDIRPIRKIENRFAKYVPQEENGGFGAAYLPDNLFGYVDVYATDNYVYGLYSGRVYTRGEAVGGTLLRIFDWTGHAVREVNIDIPCTYICVSSDDEIMLAIAEMPEPTLIRFDL
jgi:hypothetical protein